MHSLPGAELLAWQEVLPSSGRFTGLTAGDLHDLWLPTLPPGLPVEAAIDRAQPRPRRRGLKVTRRRRLAQPMSIRDHLTDPVSSTLLSCAQTLALLDLIVAVDSALHQGLVSVAGLVGVCSGGERGAPALRRALAWVDGRSESAFETLMRVLHRICGVQVVPQYVLTDPEGGFVARGDLWVVGSTVLHEYDGAHHLERRRQDDDLSRGRRITRVGWTRRGYTSRDVLQRSVGILRDMDDTVGRQHDPSRIRAWHLLLAESAFTPSGRRRLADRLTGGSTGESGQLGA